MEPCHAKSLHSFSIIKSLPDLQHFAGYIERELLTNTKPIKCASVGVKQPDSNQKFTKQKSNVLISGFFIDHFFGSEV